MRLRAMGGLANRAQAILSYLHVYGELEVEWREDQAGPGHPRDVFQPIRGVTWVEPREPVFTHHGGPVKLADGTIADNHPHGEARSGWISLYHELRLLPEHTLPETPYIAMHMRRTDFLPLARKMRCMRDDVAFYAWASQQCAPVFLATDNASTQHEMIARLHPQQVITLGDLGDVDEHDVRNSDLSRSARDLFACVAADRFYGTPGSSYTRMIEIMREIGAG